MADLLTRYWFLLEVGYGIGVTAYSVDDAIELISSELPNVTPALGAPIVNIDIQTLDQSHVIPNLGTPNVRGIWFPNLISTNESS
jgi:hypothetical protein